MLEKIQFYRSCGVGRGLQFGAVVFLLSAIFAADTSNSQQEQSNPYSVVAGQTVAREMRAGEQHTYQVSLNSGQYARITLEQKGIDVVLELLGADGKPLLKADNNLSGTRGMEVVSLLAEVSGTYQFSVQSLQKDASPGRYELRIDDVRTATDADRTRVAADRSYYAGVQLQGERKAESRRKAIDLYNEALRLMREAGDRRGEAMTLTDIGVTYHSLSQPQKALEPLNQALTIWRSIGDRHLEAVTLTMNGRAYQALGEPQKALESYNLALPVMRAIGDQSGEAGAFTDMGSFYRRIGEPQKALDYYEQALPLQRAVGDRRNEASVLNNMGTVYHLLGQSQKALNYFEQALPLVRATNDRGFLAIVLANTGNVLNVLEQREKALEYLNQALTLARDVGDRRTEAGVLSHIGNVHSFSGDHAKAFEYLDRALQLRVAASDKQGEAITLNHLGRACELGREPQKALDYYLKALPIWRAVGDRNGEVAALYGMARAENKLNNLLQASKRTEAALDIINKLRTKVASLDLRASYLASVQDIYKLHIDLLMRLHKRQPSAGFDIAALKTYEQARARSLLDMLAEASADIRQGVDPDLLERERSLQHKLNVEADRQMRLFGGQHSEDAAAAARRKIDDLVTQLLAVEADLKADSPRYAALTQPAPLGLTEIQTAVTDDATLLLEYSLGEERSYLWAVTSTSFSSYELAPRATIEAAALRCHELLTARNQYVKFETAEEKRERVRKADADYPNAATALSQILLGPVAAQLKGKRLLIVPDGALEYLPFAALTLPERLSITQNARRSRSNPASFVPLMVQHEVTSIPSASTLAVLRRELQGRAPAEKVVAVFADPVFEKTDERLAGDLSRSAGGHHGAAAASGGESTPKVEDPSQTSEGAPVLQRLPYTRQEADAILALAPSTGRKAALGFEANRAAAMSDDLSRYRIIHFATHSFLDTTHPELSAIALSMFDRQGRTQEGYLRAHEVFNLRLGAELVVLSGCRTGIGKEVKGEGLYGMTRGFMYAGSKRVMVSLWDVQDQATARLMTDFYRGLLGPKRSPTASALRAAQIAIWRDTRWQAPYYWAGFVLQGEPK